MSLETIEAKLDTLLSKLNHIGVAVDVPAYERPELAEGEVQNMDGATFNKDGSLWALNVPFSPGGTTIKIPQQIAYGYISPAKNPKFWAAAKEILGEDRFALWDAQWRANPYQIYIAAPSENLTRENMNFVMFNFRYWQPNRTFVQ